MKLKSDFIDLGKVADFRNGLNFSKATRGSGCLLIGIPDFKNRSTPDYDNLGEINPDGITQEDDFLKKSDVLFVRSNGNKELVGRSLFIDKDINALYSGFCIRTRITKPELILPKYFFYFTKSGSFRAMISTSGGTSIQNLNQEILANVKIPNRQYYEQSQIAKVLSDFDAKIELNNKINAELEAMAKLIYDYWFVQFEFPNEAGKPYKSSGGKMVWNAELKREIPEGWEVKELDSLLSVFTKGLTTSYLEKSNLINLNQKVNKGWNLDRQYFKFLDPEIEIPNEKYAHERDILINSLGQGTLGRIHYFCENAENIVVDQHLFILRVDESKITSSYLFLTLDSNPYKKQIDRQITGSTGMQMLNGSNLKSIQLMVPSLVTLSQFENIVYALFEKRIINEKENQKLAELRDWLLPMLMNGQVKVN